MLVAAVISIELLSTIRAWVGGEGLYSKGQKNSTYYLSQYALSHSEEDFRLYQAAIAFPLGDWKARLALQRRPVDLRAARAGFLSGLNEILLLGGSLAVLGAFAATLLVREREIEREVTEPARTVLGVAV